MLKRVDVKFYKKLCIIGLPIAIQHFLNSLIYMIDTIMVGTMGESSLGAVGVSNKLFFVLNLSLYGVASGTAIFVSQYWGKKDMKSIRKATSLALCFACFFGVIAFIIGFFASEIFMKIFTPNKEVIDNGVQYLSIVSFGYLITAISFVFTFVLRSCKKVLIPLMASIISIILNIFLNWVFIFGGLGVEPMGIQGAAMATVISKGVELSILLGNIYVRKSLKEIRVRVKDFKSITKEYAFSFLSKTFTIMGNEMLWGIGTSVLFMIYGRMGTTVLATMTVIQSIEEMSNALLIGNANACAIILGNEFGQKNIEKVNKYSRSFKKVAIFIGLFVGGFIIINMDSILILYTVGQEYVESIRLCMFVLSGFLAVKALNFTYIEGIFRSGGDTKYIIKVDMGVVWLVGIPMAIATGLWLSLPIYVVYAMVLIMEIIKVILNQKRYISKKWINILVS